ncbi:hypothetical protein [Lentzea sp. NPDC051838]|uniref:hypothetical protein n=1 Tax=Lentzea sp. NPDC051838 TaxID=3154849 RepID=UPI003447E3F4
MVSEILVNDDVVAELRAGDPARAAVFTASCAERLVQLFTGLRGDDPARAGDVEILLDVLDELWDATLPGSVFASRAERLERFVEIVRADNGEELTTAVDAYAFHSVLAVLHAAGYRDGRLGRGCLVCPCGVDCDGAARPERAGRGQL